MPTCHVGSIGDGTYLSATAAVSDADAAAAGNEASTRCNGENQGRGGGGGGGVPGLVLLVARGAVPVFVAVFVGVVGSTTRLVSRW